MVWFSSTSQISAASERVQVRKGSLLLEPPRSLRAGGWEKSARYSLEKSVIGTVECPEYFSAVCRRKPATPKPTERLQSAKIYVTTSGWLQLTRIFAKLMD